MTPSITDENTVWEGAKLKVIERDLVLDNGREVTWEIIEKPDSVAIVPITEDKEVYLLRQYFGAQEAWGYTLPKGGIEPGETPEEAATRELREETGLEGTLEHLSALSVSPGYLTQVTTIFLATDLSEHPEGPVEDVEEPLEVVKLPLDEAFEKVLSEDVSQSRTVAGLSLAARSID